MTKAKKSQRVTRKRGNLRRNQSGGRWKWLNAGIVTALVGAIGAALAAVLAVTLPHYLDGSPPSAPDLEVDSVTTLSYAQQHPSLVSKPSSGPGYETLDFKIRNTGDQLAFINGVRITVHSIEKFFPNFNETFVPVSARYEFVIPTTTGTFTAPVSEEVAPDQADRFDLNISLPKSTQFHLFIYNVSLALVYNKGISLNAGEMSLNLSPGYTTGITVEISSSPPSGGLPIRIRRNPGETLMPGTCF